MFYSLPMEILSSFQIYMKHKENWLYKQAIQNRNKSKASENQKFLSYNIVKLKWKQGTHRERYT